MSRKIQEYMLPDCGQKVNNIAWSYDGSFLASHTFNGEILIWNSETQQLQHCIASDCTSLSCLAWSPDSRSLAAYAAGKYKAIRLWDVETGKEQRPITDLTQWITCLSWSPDGHMFAGGSSDGTIRLWNIQTRQHTYTAYGHTEKVSCLAWSPNGRVLASGSKDRSITLWQRDRHTLKIDKTLNGHFHEISCLSWLAEENLLASGSFDRTIRLWDPESGREKRIMEAHTANITSLTALNTGHLLASKAEVVRVWSTRTCEPIELLQEISPANHQPMALAFHPYAPWLAVPRRDDRSILVLDMQEAQHLEDVHLAHSVEKMVHYTNAKVVLVGEAGVGKSALSLVLTGKPFTLTPSSHACQVFSFDNQTEERTLKDGSRLKTDTLLWDLAGQPGYRLIHQLHLRDVVVALILFDSHSDTDPFAGVDYWNKALAQAKKAQGPGAVPAKKLLVASRIDVGGRRVSLQRIQDFAHEHGFEAAFYETSAKDSRGVQELIEGIKAAIDWEVLPRITSPDLFQTIKSFLLNEKKQGRLLEQSDNLYQLFLARNVEHRHTTTLHAQFETCINLAVASGLIYRLSFNNYVLLQPELIDVYASALANSVSSQPDGMGSILEEDVLSGNFTLPADKCVADKDQERILLVAMVEDLLRNEVVLRDQGFLVFPSQSTREYPEMPDLKGKKKTLVFTLEGPVMNAYAILAVRLAHSKFFINTQIWKNAVVYTTALGGVYGLSLHYLGEGQGKLTLFFDANVSEEMCRHFENFVEDCLERYTLTFWRERIYVCDVCNSPIDSSNVEKRRSLGFNWIRCQICDAEIPLRDDVSRSIMRLEEMHREADKQRDAEVNRTARLTQKIAMQEFDIYFCYNDADRDEIKNIGSRLKAQGFLPFMSEWDIRPGELEQNVREKQMQNVKCAAVFISKTEVQPWDNLERSTLLRQFVAPPRHIIPVLLTGAQKTDLPPFLGQMKHIDFNRSDPDPLQQLIFGITGTRAISP